MSVAACDTNFTDASPETQRGRTVPYIQLRLLLLNGVEMRDEGVKFFSLFVGKIDES
jgi:hypothetical protein